MSTKKKFYVFLGGGIFVIFCLATMPWLRLSETSRIIVLMNSFIFSLVFFIAAWQQSEEDALRRQSTVIEKYLRSNNWTIVSLGDIDASITSLPEHFLWNRPEFTVGTPLYFARRDVNGLTVWFIFRRWRTDHGKNSVDYLDFELRARLPGKIPGWVRILPIKSDEAETSLEWNDFSKKYWLNADPDKLAFRVFSPDLMTWYEDHTVHNIFHIEQDDVVVQSNGNVPKKVVQQIESTVKDLIFLVAQINNNGVLEKKAEPLFPRIQ